MYIRRLSDPYRCILVSAKAHLTREAGKVNLGCKIWPRCILEAWFGQYSRFIYFLFCLLAHSTSIFNSSRNVGYFKIVRKFTFFISCLICIIWVIFGPYLEKKISKLRFQIRILRQKVRLESWFWKESSKIKVPIFCLICIFGSFLAHISSTKKNFEICFQIRILRQKVRLGSWFWRKSRKIKIPIFCLICIFGPFLAHISSTKKNFENLVFRFGFYVKKYV